MNEQLKASRHILYTLLNVFTVSDLLSVFHANLLAINIMRFQLAFELCMSEICKKVALNYTNASQVCRREKHFFASCLSLSFLPSFQRFSSPRLKCLLLFGEKGERKVITAVYGAFFILLLRTL
jgi:hypothetical protein